MRAPRLSRALATTAAAAALAAIPFAGVASAAPGAPRAAAPPPAPPCAVGSLCVWDQENFTGNRRDLVTCGTITPVGVQSYVNNQFAGTVATFYGPGEHSQQDFQFTSTAFEARATKTGITPNGIGPTTAVKAC